MHPRVPVGVPVGVLFGVCLGVLVGASFVVVQFGGQIDVGIVEPVVRITTAVVGRPVLLFFISLMSP